MTPDAITLVVPYYRQPQMLATQLNAWAGYPADVRSRFRFIVVDDGSPEPAAPIVEELRGDLSLELYRVGVDIPWNQHGARNLGAQVAPDGWLLMLDLDHVLLAPAAAALLQSRVDGRCWYRLRRRRTRQLERGLLETVEIKPHINSFMVTKGVYWHAGGYDEDYCGCLCGDSQFHRALVEVAKLEQLDVFLDCYGASLIPDSATPYLPRDQAQRDECARRIRYKERRGDTRAKNPIRFPWERVL